MSKVYIIILNYKKWQDVVECLESVFRLKYENFTAIVIDNDSRNNSLKYLIQWAKDSSSVPDPSVPPFSKNVLEKPIGYEFFHNKDLDTTDPLIFPRLVFIQNDRNNGFAGGNNIVLRLLMKQDAYVWLLNPDMVVDENSLSELVDFASAQPFKTITGAVTKSYLYPDRVFFYGGGKINFNSATIDIVNKIDEVPNLDFISGGAMFIHTRHLNDIGLLPEFYFLYWEDTDWCYRAKIKGYQMSVCASAICYDKVSTTIGKSFLADYCYTTNGLLFISKYKKRKIPVAVFSAFLRLGKRILTGKWSRANGVYKGILAFLNRQDHEDK